jgi:hypothetical protein
MEEVTELDKTIYEELNDLWNIWGRTAMHTGFWLVSLSERKRPLGRPRYKSQDTNKRGNVRINVTLRRVRETTVAVEKQ